MIFYLFFLLVGEFRPAPTLRDTRILFFFSFRGKWGENLITHQVMIGAVLIGEIMRSNILAVVYDFWRFSRNFTRLPAWRVKSVSRFGRNLKRLSCSLLDYVSKTALLSETMMDLPVGGLRSFREISSALQRDWYSRSKYYNCWILPIIRYNKFQLCCVNKNQFSRHIFSSHKRLFWLNNQ